MDQPLIQALTGLMPTKAGPMPPEVVELAVSLLAQSRSKASTLKAEEEIARPYACAHLACERLKQSLNLPKLQPRPPCPPRVYQKLYRYLDNVLPSALRKIAQTQKHGVTSSNPTSSSAKPRTPAKAKHVRPDAPQWKTNAKPATLDSELPIWVPLPTWISTIIRRLCETMRAPAAPPHIFACICSIHRAQQTTDVSQPPKSGVQTNLPALIVAAYILVTTRLIGDKTVPADYKRQRRSAVGSVNENLGRTEELRRVSESDVDNCMRDFIKNEWTKMDWFENIPSGAGIDITDGDVETAQGTSSDDQGDEGQLLPMESKDRDSLQSFDSNYLRAGLGTMMREQVDYLSDSRRHEFRRWKTDILLRLEELEKTKA